MPAAAFSWRHLNTNLMEPKRSYRVAIIDDHPATRLGLRELLETWPHGKVTILACDGIDYEEQCRTHGAPDIALVDLMMPNRNGWETLAWIRDEQPDTLGVAITFMPEPHHVSRAMSAGARTVLAKDVDIPELHAALDDLRLTGHHHNALMAGQLQLLDQLLAERDTKAAIWRKLREELSGRQFELLGWLLYEQSLTLKEIAVRMKLTYNTVEHHRKGLYERLGVHDRRELWMLAIRLGLVSATGSVQVPKAKASRAAVGRP